MESNIITALSHKQVTPPLMAFIVGELKSHLHIDSEDCDSSRRNQITLPTFPSTHTKFYKVRKLLLLHIKQKGLLKYNNNFTQTSSFTFFEKIFLRQIYSNFFKQIFKKIFYLNFTFKGGHY